MSTHSNNGSHDGQQPQLLSSRSPLPQQHSVSHPYRIDPPRTIGLGENGFDPSSHHSHQTSLTPNSSSMDAPLTGDTRHTTTQVESDKPSVTVLEVWEGKTLGAKTPRPSVSQTSTSSNHTHLSSQTRPSLSNNGDASQLQASLGPWGYHANRRLHIDFDQSGNDDMSRSPPPTRAPYLSSMSSLQVNESSSSLHPPMTPLAQAHPKSARRRRRSIHGMTSPFGVEYQPSVEANLTQPPNSSGVSGVGSRPRSSSRVGHAPHTPSLAAGSSPLSHDMDVEGSRPVLDPSPLDSSPLGFSQQQQTPPPHHVSVSITMTLCISFFILIAGLGSIFPTSSILMQLPYLIHIYEDKTSIVPLTFCAIYLGALLALATYHIMSNCCFCGVHHPRRKQLRKRHKKSKNRHQNISTHYFQFFHHDPEVRHRSQAINAVLIVLFSMVGAASVFLLGFFYEHTALVDGDHLRPVYFLSAALLCGFSVTGISLTHYSLISLFFDTSITIFNAGAHGGYLLPVILVLIQSAGLDKDQPDAFRFSIATYWFVSGGILMFTTLCSLLVAIYAFKTKYHREPPLTEIVLSAHLLYGKPRDVMMDLTTMYEEHAPQKHKGTHGSRVQDIHIVPNDDNLIYQRPIQDILDIQPFYDIHYVLADLVYYNEHAALGDPGLLNYHLNIRHNPYYLNYKAPELREIRTYYSNKHAAYERDAVDVEEYLSVAINREIAQELAPPPRTAHQGTTTMHLNGEQAHSAERGDLSQLGPSDQHQPPTATAAAAAAIASVMALPESYNQDSLGAGRSDEHVITITPLTMTDSPPVRQQAPPSDRKVEYEIAQLTPSVLSRGGLLSSRRDLFISPNASYHDSSGGGGPLTTTHHDAILHGRQSLPRKSHLRRASVHPFSFSGSLDDYHPVSSAGESHPAQPHKAQPHPHNSRRFPPSHVNSTVAMYDYGHYRYVYPEYVDLDAGWTIDDRFAIHELFGFEFRPILPPSPDTTSASLAAPHPPPEVAENYTPTPLLYYPRPQYDFLYMSDHLPRVYNDEGNDVLFNPTNYMLFLKFRNHSIALALCSLLYTVLLPVMLPYVTLPYHNGFELYFYSQCIWLLVVPVSRLAVYLAFQWIRVQALQPSLLSVLMSLAVITAGYIVLVTLHPDPTPYPYLKTYGWLLSAGGIAIAGFMYTLGNAMLSYKFHNLLFSHSYYSQILQNQANSDNTQFHDVTHDASDAARHHANSDATSALHPATDSSPMEAGPGGFGSPTTSLAANNKPRRKRRQRHRRHSALETSGDGTTISSNHGVVEMVDLAGENPSPPRAEADNVSERILSTISEGHISAGSKGVTEQESLPPPGQRRPAHRSRGAGVSFADVGNMTSTDDGSPEDDDDDDDDDDDEFRLASYQTATKRASPRDGDGLPHEDHRAIHRALLSQIHLSLRGGGTFHPAPHTHHQAQQHPSHRPQLARPTGHAQNRQVMRDAAKMRLAANELATERYIKKREMEELKKRKLKDRGKQVSSLLRPLFPFGKPKPAGDQQHVKGDVPSSPRKAHRQGTGKAALRQDVSHYSSPQLGQTPRQRNSASRMSPGSRPKASRLGLDGDGLNTASTQRRQRKLARDMLRTNRRQHRLLTRQKHLNIGASASDTNPAGGADQMTSQGAASSLPSADTSSAVVPASPDANPSNPLGATHAYSGRRTPRHSRRHSTSTVFRTRQGSSSSSSSSRPPQPTLGEALGASPSTLTAWSSNKSDAPQPVFRDDSLFNPKDLEEIHDFTLDTHHHPLYLPKPSAFPLNNSVYPDDTGDSASISSKPGYPPSSRRGSLIDTDSSGSNEESRSARLRERHKQRTHLVTSPKEDPILSKYRRFEDIDNFSHDSYESSTLSLWEPADHVCPFSGAPLTMEALQMCSDGLSFEPLMHTPSLGSSKSVFHKPPSENGAAPMFDAQSKSRLFDDAYSGDDTSLSHHSGFTLHPSQTPKRRSQIEPGSLDFGHYGDGVSRMESNLTLTELHDDDRGSDHDDPSHSSSTAQILGRFKLSFQRNLFPSQLPTNVSPRNIHSAAPIVTSSSLSSIPHSPLSKANHPLGLSSPSSSSQVPTSKLGKLSRSYSASNQPRSHSPRHLPTTSPSSSRPTETKTERSATQERSDTVRHEDEIADIVVVEVLSSHYTRGDDDHRIQIYDSQPAVEYVGGNPYHYDGDNTDRSEEDEDHEDEFDHGDGIPPEFMLDGGYEDDSDPEAMDASDFRHQLVATIHDHEQMSSLLNANFSVEFASAIHVENKLLHIVRHSSLLGSMIGAILTFLFFIVFSAVSDPLLL